MITLSYPNNIKNTTFIYLASIISEVLEDDSNISVIIVEISLTNYFNFWPEKLKSSVEDELRQSLKIMGSMSISVSSDDDVSSSSVFDTLEYDKENQMIIFSLNESALIFKNQTKLAFESLIPSISSSFYH